MIKWKQNQQECIPVRCVPPAHWPHLVISAGRGWLRPRGRATPAPLDRILDTRLWKHYLPATSVAGGKMLSKILSPILPNLYNHGRTRSKTEQLHKYKIRLKRFWWVMIPDMRSDVYLHNKNIQCTNCNIHSQNIHKMAPRCSGQYGQANRGWGGGGQEGCTPISVQFFFIFVRFSEKKPPK